MRNLDFNKVRDGHPELEETGKKIEKQLNNSHDGDTDSEQDISTSSDVEENKDHKNEAAAKIQKIYRSSLFSRNETRKAEAANKIQGLHKYFAAKPKFKYITWADAIASSNILGIDYDICHAELLDNYKASKAASVRKKASQGEADFYKKTEGSALAFIKNNLKGLVAAYENSEKLETRQKESVKEIVEQFGIQYQLEMGAFVAACADKHDSFDTLFYQNAVGSTLESIVSSKNKKYDGVEGRQPFEIRERKVAGKTSPAPEGFTQAKKQSDAASSVQDAHNSADTVVAFKALCDRIKEKKVAVHNSVIDKHFSSDFEGRKVLAPISVKSSCASADGYNTAEGIRAFAKNLDPRLESLTLVRVDTAHIWTELQVAILEKARDCSEEELVEYMSRLFVMGEDGSLNKDSDTGFYQLNKESEEYKRVYQNTLDSGEEWQTKFFKPLVDVLKKNHFQEEEKLIDDSVKDVYSRLDDAKSEKVFAENFKYKSRCAEEMDQVDKIIESYNEKLLPLIKGWWLSSGNMGDAFAEETTKTTPTSRLATLSIVVMLIDNNIFVDTVNKIAAEAKKGKGRYQYSTETLKSIKQKAIDEIEDIFSKNDELKQKLDSKLDAILSTQDGVYQDEGYVEEQLSDFQHDDYEYILEITYRYGRDEGVAEADAVEGDQREDWKILRRLEDLEKIKEYCRHIRPKCSVAAKNLACERTVLKP